LPSFRGYDDRRPNQGPSSPTSRILIQLEQDWDAAFRRKDLPFIETVLADEFVATYSDGSRGDRAKELGAGRGVQPAD